MKNLSHRIWLNVGNDIFDDTDFHELEGVTWNEFRVDRCDVAYVLEEEDRRLKVATALMSGILSNLEVFDASTALKWGRPRKSEIAKIALAYADALLEENAKKY